MESLHGQTIRVMSDSSNTTTSADRVSTDGETSAATRARGKTTRCTALAPSRGQMAAIIRETTLRIKKKGKACSPGPMAVAMKDRGKTASSTEEANSQTEKARLRPENGSKANASGGMMSTAIA